MSVLLARGVRWMTPGRSAAAVLNGVDVDLEPGVAALVGPNGAGKTTLLRILAGLLPPYEGHVEVGGTALQDSPSRVRQLVGYVPQFPGLYRGLTVLQHFERQRVWLPRAARGESRPKLGDVLDEWGLGAVRHRRADRLSDPLRRRVALALLWARGVQVALMDEPTAGLDPEGRWQFWNQVVGSGNRERGTPAAVLITTHLLDEVESFASRVVFLKAGRVRFQGTVERLAQAAVGRTVTMSGGRGTHRQELWEVGMDEEGRTLALIGGRTPTLEQGWVSRPPTVQDGYLAVDLLGGEESPNDSGAPRGHVERRSHKERGRRQDGIR